MTGLLTDGNMAQQLPFFGQSHRDKNDFAGAMSCMIPTSDLQNVPGEEQGRFHLLTRGAYVALDPFCPVFFSGLLPHGGISSIAPPGEKAPAWSHRSALIGYPPSKVMEGGSRHSFTELPFNNEPIYITPEIVGVL